MNSVSISDGLAAVGAGARLGDLYDALTIHGRTIPAGCGSPVGIAGLTLGGGLGPLARKYGLTCDHLRGVEVVLADGRIVDCDEGQDGDLFWALRGAGGGHLGVVTSFLFSTVPAPTSTCFHLLWSPIHAAAVIDAWQRWAPVAPEKVDANLRLTVSEVDVPSPVVNLVGAMHGTETDTALVLGEFVGLVGAKPASELRRQMSYRNVKRHLSGLGSIDSDGDTQLGHMFSKSEFFRRRLPDDAISALVGNLTAGRVPGQSRELNFTPWGGAYNRVPAEATAFVHREEFIVEHVVVVEPAAPSAERAAAHDWLTNSWALVHPWGSGRVYPNFPDPDLEDWAQAYYGNNYDRLVEVKVQYDPTIGSRSRSRSAADSATRARHQHNRSPERPLRREPDTNGKQMTDSPCATCRPDDVAGHASTGPRHAGSIVARCTTCVEQAGEKSFDRVVGLGQRCVGVWRGGDEHRGFADGGEDHAGQRVDLGLVNAPGLGETSNVDLEAAEDVLAVQLAPADPADHGWGVEEGNALDGRVEGQPEEGTAAGSKALEWVPTRAGRLSDSRGQGRRLAVEDGIEQGGFGGEVVVKGTASDPGRRHDRFDRGGVVAAAAEELAGRGEEEFTSGSSLLYSPVYLLEHHPGQISKPTIGLLT